MEDVGVSKETYSKMRADKIANVVVNSCPAHLTLPQWTDLISQSLGELIPANHPDDAFADLPAEIHIGNTDNP